ncbi:MAG: nucleotide exchange factor GrpE [Acidobacteriaceae bacterium]
MNKKNGKSQVKDQGLDLEHELSSGQESDQNAAIGVEESQDFPQSADRDGELQKLKAERDTLVDRLARSQAEFDNARKRASREQQEFREYAAADTIKALLPILDSFERALKMNASDKSEFHSGVELIHRQLLDALQKLGVRPITAEGEPFDPRVHEAIEMVDTSDADDQQVLEELQRGYKLKERLLRPAMVKVARNS